MKKNEKLRLQIICVLFACFLWVYVMSDIDPVTTRVIHNVPVTLLVSERLKEENLMLSGEAPVLSVTVKSRRSVLSKVTSSPVVISARIAQPKEGINQASLAIENKNSAAEYILPTETLDLQLERKITVEREVEILKTGKSPQGYEIKEFAAIPKKVTLSGPRSLIESIKSVSAALDISAIKEDFSKKCDLLVLDRSGKPIGGIEKETDSIYIKGTVLRSKSVPVVLKSADAQSIDPARYSLEPSQVQISGKANDVERITALETSPVKLQQLMEQENLELALQVPQNINAAFASVRVKNDFQEKISRDFQIPKNRIAVRGGAPVNFNSRPQVPALIQVRVEVARKYAQALKEEDIFLYVNAQDLLSSPASVPIHYEIKYPGARLTLSPLSINASTRPSSAPAEPPQNPNPQNPPAQPPVTPSEPAEPPASAPAPASPSEPATPSRPAPAP